VNFSDSELTAYRSPVGLGPSVEDVAEMAVAAGTENFRARAVGVFVLQDILRTDRLEKSSGQPCPN